LLAAGFSSSALARSPATTQMRRSATVARLPSCARVKAQRSRVRIATKRLRATPRSESRKKAIARQSWSRT
jgi:hypothetical protein